MKSYHIMGVCINFYIRNHDDKYIYIILKKNNNNFLKKSLNESDYSDKNCGSGKKLQEKCRKIIKNNPYQSEDPEL